MIAIEFFLGSTADRAVREVWAALEEAGIGSLATATHGNHHPHVTLAVINELRPDVAERLASALPALPELHLDAAGCFPGRRGAVVFLAVRMTPELLALHQAVHEILDRSDAGSLDQLRPGRLFPHCTVAKRVPPDRLGEAMTIARDRLPISDPAESINAVVVGGDGAVRPIR